MPNDFRLAALLRELMNALLAHGSWCGETHIQKSAFFVQEVGRINLGVAFTLYKFGPFSFELRDELANMRSQGFIDLQPKPPYGPGLRPSHFSEWLDRVGLVTDDERNRIGVVAAFVGNSNVLDLERLATALYAIRTRPADGMEAQAALVHDVKPHVSIEEARGAVSMVQAFERKAEAHLRELQ